YVVDDNVVDINKADPTIPSTIIEILKNGDIDKVKKLQVAILLPKTFGATDWQNNKALGQLLLGKAMDTFCPVGPCITTSDEIDNPQALNISCIVNGVQKQKSNTNQFIHKIPEIIERLSNVFHLTAW
ncbi:unnamed protein product, partial [Arctia plantaginis]